LRELERNGLRPQETAQALDVSPIEPRDSHGEGAAPISRIVAEVAQRFPGPRISLGEMAEAFEDRAFGLLILLLCLPSLLPGMASVFGIPMLILGVQMGIGLRVPKLPRFIARQSVKREDLMRLTTASSAMLGRVERYVRPRPGIWTGRWGDRVVGWLTVYSALMLILPGPGTNGPPAFGTIVMSLGVVEHDNRVIGIGAVVTLLGCLFATVIVGGMFWLGIKALGYVF